MQPGDPVFAIGIAEGVSPLELTAPAAPILVGEDVTDVTATYVADPFVVRRGERWHMFLEVWDYDENKGAIGLAQSGDGRRWRYDRIVLAEKFHLSYPYVFEWAGEVYLVPESFQAGAVRLYRASSFPTGWTLVQELVEGDGLVDATPFRAGGRWWMLVGTVDHDTLRLFHAGELTGPWLEHPSSPVVAADPVRARPAGRMLDEGGRLYRFAQRCDTAYGLDVRAFEILELTPTRYAERELPGPVLAASGAGWNANGMHHVDAHRLGPGRWIVYVDGWYEAPQQQV